MQEALRRRMPAETKRLISANWIASIDVTVVVIAVDEAWMGLLLMVVKAELSSMGDNLRYELG